MLQIYGVELSFPTNKVRFTANALGLEYSFKRVNLAAGEQKQPEFLKLNPIGKVPVLKDDELCLFESNAICRYLARKEKSPLFPEELSKQAIVDQWMEFHSHHLGLAVSKVLFNTHFYKMLGVQKDERSLQEGAEMLTNYIHILDGQLEGKSYHVGSSMTLADLTLVAVLDPLDVLDFELSRFTNVTRIRDAFRQESFYTACHKNYKEVLEAMIQARQ